MSGRHAGPARRADGRSRPRSAARQRCIDLDRGLLRQRARRRHDRRRSLRVRRELRRALVRSHQLRRRRRVGGRRPLRPRRREARRSCPACSRSSAITRSATSRRSCVAAGGRRRLRAPRRSAADAALRPRGRYRDVRRARDHPQRPAVLREDRARLEHVLVGPRDDRSAAGGDRRPARDRRRLRLPAQPLRPPPARDARGRRGRSGRRRIACYRQRL